MKDGFIKIAAGAVQTTVADVTKNIAAIAARIEEADAAGVNLLVLPELCITSYTCGDLFFSDVLLDAAQNALAELAKITKGKFPVVIVGLPLRARGKLFNCAAVLHNGKILGIVPKVYLPNYHEFYEMRQFSPASMLPDDVKSIPLAGVDVPFGKDLLFAHKTLSHYVFGVEICEDLWAPVPPSEKLALAGATILCNLSASNETVGKADYRRLLVRATSARLLSAYVFCSAGNGESTQDLVFSAHNLMAENGSLLAESQPFENKSLTMTEVDVNRLATERHANTTFRPEESNFRYITFSQEVRQTSLTRKWEQNPFVPNDPTERHARAAAILRMQAEGLRKRLDHCHADKVVVGISGGLDSTLALLVALEAFRLSARPAAGILAVTMPGFGTTNRTLHNAQILCRCAGVSFREISIAKAVTQHFSDIGHDPTITDVTYENSQARERTQILMDLANQEGALLIGTGDLSELALGWATYNGDHMSMYAVNTSIPKTLVRYLIRYVADNSETTIASVLRDILETPVSPELLPADSEGKISQKTEDLVGPYELHDFFLYFTLRCGYAPDKILRLALPTFAGVYDESTIRKWLSVFIRRFFSQQFKRSCLPDGPKVGSVTLSPRGDWRMPSDASCAEWLKRI